VDDDYNKYANNGKGSGDKYDAPLVKNAAGFGRNDSTEFENMQYADPYNTSRDGAPDAKSSAWSRFADSGRYPLEQRIEDKKRGIGKQRYPFVAWTLTAAMIGVFIYELVLNWRAQGTPFSFKPTVNPMFGPSMSALINSGARFVPCMKQVQGLPANFDFPCLNDTANPATSLCPISEVCGFGGFGNSEPNQWFRFITPIFLHAGLVHIALNLFAQMTLSAQVEREMGSAAFFILYFAAGIFGNVLGANFSLLGAPSVGASGAIFGCVAVEWVDLAFHWKLTFRPVRKLMFLIVDLIVGVALGYVPFIDNFAHLGGLFIGLFAAMMFYPIISTTKKHKMITWAFRIAAIPVPIILYVVLTKNFYTGNPYSACSGCRYLSCFPTSSNNHCHGTGLSLSNGTTLTN